MSTTYTIGNAVVIEGPIAPEQAPPRHLAVGSFFDRFGDAKWPILSSTDPMVRAVIMDAQVRQYIDLDNPQLPAGLAVLESAGFTIDTESILNDPIQPGERP